MGSWDELCILCGVAPAGGPIRMISDNDIEHEAKSILQDIRDGGLLPHLQDDEIKLFKRQCMASTGVLPQDFLAKPSWIPEGMSEPSRKCVAVGHFDSFGEPRIEGTKAPTGKDVEVHNVLYGCSGSFNAVVDEEGTVIDRHLVCSIAFENNPNFFLCQLCFHYLEAWLPMFGVMPMHTRQSPSNGQHLPFSGELYEIVNSREQRRHYPSGLLPGIEYDGIEASLEQWQRHFIPCRKSVKHLAQAIEERKQDQDLVAALLRDCRGWMFTDPAMWPKPYAIDSNLTPTFTREFASTSPTPPSKIETLPNELLPPILRDLPLRSLLALSATCRSLRTLITEPSFLDVILRDSISHGELHWILPVASAQSDMAAAYEAVRLWLPENGRPQPLDVDECLSEDTDVDSRTEIVVPPVMPLILSPEFPRLAFLRVCWESDSMMSRRRLWKQVEQFGFLWKDYRSHGWKVDRFIPTVAEK